MQFAQAQLILDFQENEFLKSLLRGTLRATMQELHLSKDSYAPYSLLRTNHEIFQILSALLNKII